MLSRRLPFLICLLVLFACEDSTPIEAPAEDTAADMSQDLNRAPDGRVSDLSFELVEDLSGDEASTLELGPTLDADGDQDGPEPGTAGAPCSEADDCISGFCIQTADGRRCTQTCVEECPFDWECLPHLASQPDEVYLCVPTSVELCKPCLANHECFANGADGGQVCVSYGSQGSFCGTSCADDEDCPTGYGCQTAPDVSGQNEQQCVLEDGVCACRQWFVDQGAATSCFVDNEHGLCGGERICLAGGLTECDAAVPAPENCNGQDDDCDGDIDEETSGGPCFVTNQFGACPGTEKCAAGELVCEGDKPAKEQCDGMDNDCDGDIDEGFPDTDEDGEADCLENDLDGDGVVDLKDNCPADFNPDQADFDLDNFGDLCDADDDNDMTADGEDCKPKDNAVHPGAEEVCDGQDNNCNLLVDEGYPDSDADGWKNCIDDDDDGDGTDDGEDCAPLDPAISPASKEVCDGVDNDCDGAVDQGFVDLDDDGEADCVDLDDDGDAVDDAEDNCPAVPNGSQDDQDQDGVGDDCDSDLDGDGIPNAMDNCPLLSNPAQGNTDQDEFGDLCDDDQDGDGVADVEDNCPFVANPGQEDGDQDGVGNACESDLDGDGAPDDVDCAPAVPTIHPGAIEVCNGLDDDCDQAVDEGLGQTSCGLGQCKHTQDKCIEGALQVCNPFVGTALESCDNLDNDCDGLIDEDLGSTTCGLGQCTHTVANCVDGQGQECDPLAGSAEEICDGLDNDCDGKTDEDLATLTCGKGQCFHTVAACVGGVAMECNPFAGAGPEVCDGIDNDCDGEADEDLGTVTCGLGECAHEMAYCAQGKVQVCNPLQGAQLESCDGKDNDCDGLIDEELGTTTCGEGVCENSVLNCLDGQPQECDPLDGAMDETCDGLDNDCDGVVDPEDSLDCTWYFADADFDGYGIDGTAKCLCEAKLQYSATEGGDCNDDDGDINPGQDENCLTAVDEDCSGAANEDCVYTSCKAIVAAMPASPSGSYTLDPDGDGQAEPFTAYCEMSVDGGGWTLVAKVSGADAKNWGCKNQPGCSGSLWANGSTLNVGSAFGANEDAKFPAFMQIKGTDILFYDVVDDTPIMYANDMYGSRTLESQVGQLAWKGGCTCCSEEYPVSWVKTGKPHLFCTTNDCSANARIGFWCMDEESWGSRDFNLIAMPNNSSFDYNFGNKPGIASDRLDPGHSGGSSVDADGELGGTSDGRRWQHAAAIFVR